MAQLSEAIARYHKLLEDNGFSDLSWAEELQSRMRDQGLTDSGRPVAPILRPQFISRRQLDALTRVTHQLAAILDQVEALALESPALLSRLQVLPAEKMLAAIPAGYTRCSITSCMDVKLQNGSLSVCGYQTCKPKALAYSQPLADLFLDLSIVKSFKRGRYKLSKVGQAENLTKAVLEVWKEWGGRHQPNIAVVEFSDGSETNPSEGRLLAQLFTAAGLPSRVLLPDHLSYSNGILRADDFKIDLVFRRFGTAELLAHFNLSHPLLAAYRDRAICMVNSFRSEIAHRRALFELLTDETIAARFSAEDRKLINTYVPWTRVVSQRKTKYKGKEIDLAEFILRQRELLVLRPNQDSLDLRTYIGAQMTQPAWESALRSALRSFYVVQEHACCDREPVPVFLYGEVHIKDAEVCVHPQMFNGQMRGASAALETYSSGYSTPLAIAPVLLLENA